MFIALGAALLALFSFTFLIPLTGLSLILAFIGVKLALHYLHKQNDAVPEIATTTSLIVIATTLTATTVASILKARRDPTARAHAGSLREQKKTPEPV